MAFMENCAIQSTFDCPDNIREDVLDVMVNLSPTDTPFWSGWGKTTMGNPLKEWLVDYLGRASDPNNPVVECARESSDFDFDELDCPCRVNNQVHLLRKTGDVSWLQRAMNTIGYADEYARQVQRQMTRLNLVTEFALIHSVRGNTAQTAPQADGVCASPSGCRMMDGILAIAAWDETAFDCLTSEMVQGTVLEQGSPCEPLTPYLMDNLFQIMHHKGARTSNQIWVNTTLKRVIDGFWYAGQVKNADVADRKLMQVVDFYQSSFGMKSIDIHLDLPWDVLLVLDPQYIDIAIAYPAKVVPLAQVSNSYKFGMEHALTLVERAPQTLGVIDGLCTDDICYTNPCDDGAVVPPQTLPRDGT